MRGAKELLVFISVSQLNYLTYIRSAVLETIVGGVSWNRVICLVTGKEHAPLHFNVKSHSSIHTDKQELRTGNRETSCQGDYSENGKVNLVAQGKQLEVAEVNSICLYKIVYLLARLSKTTENTKNGF